MIGSDEYVSTLHIVYNDTKNVRKLLHRIFTSLEDFLLSGCFITDSVYRVVVDVNYFFATYKLSTLSAFHIQYI